MANCIAGRWEEGEREKGGRKGGRRGREGERERGRGKRREKEEGIAEGKLHEATSYSTLSHSLPVLIPHPLFISFCATSSPLPSPLIPLPSLLIHLPSPLSPSLLSPLTSHLSLLPVSVVKRTREITSKTSLSTSPGTSWQPWEESPLTLRCSNIFKWLSPTVSVTSHFVNRIVAAMGTR